MDLYSPQAIWGRELRHHRQTAGLTQAQLAVRIRFSESLISGIETGQVPAGTDFAAACDEVLGTGGALLRQLDWRKGDRFPAWFGEWPRIEAKAIVLRAFQLSVIDGLLQTKAYATALLRDEDAVAARLERQDILVRESPPPPKLRCIFDEAVLHRPVGDAATMYEQLTSLIEVTANPRITVQVIPYGTHPGVKGSFVTASMGAGSGEVAYLETAAQGQIVRKPEDLEALTDLWESLQTYALPQRDSLELIRRTADDRWT
ncbi:helix-turn-helix domain-containing protein [Actinomadura scrupuli]|uniref:helix-turn-helix domain-containing protein n=1 Tax=Actinomadura scrupuli TaxID=559629 RepID=UPI003D967B88